LIRLDGGRHGFFALLAGGDPNGEETRASGV
jgi:hypothetical protein